MNWISVSERLRDDDDEVLMYAGEEYFVGCYERDTWWFSDYDIEGVTHWMPLPEPPSDEGKAMIDDLRAAAVELREHAWLSRFRQANYKNKYNELSPQACNDIARYVDGFILKILDSTPPDEEDKE